MTWIKCKDRLPQPMKIVLILVDGKSIKVSFRSTTGNWRIPELDHSYRPELVTHWMELPALPSDNEDGSDSFPAYYKLNEPSDYIATFEDNESDISEHLKINSAKGLGGGFVGLRGRERE